MSVVVDSDSRRVDVMDSQHGLPMFIVDAFTSAPFSGNPAAVCLLTADHVTIQYTCIYSVDSLRVLYSRLA